MPNALTDTNISTTYAGVLHAQGEPIPATGLKVVYDGVGNKSSLSVGRDGQGIRVTGTIIADSIAVGGGGLDTSSVQAIVDLIYPVGALLITTNSTAPSYPGTTWVRKAEGKFIAGVGTGNDGSDSVAIAAGDDSNQTNQGKYNVTLDTSQMPSHTHLAIAEDAVTTGRVNGTNSVKLDVNIALANYQIPGNPNFEYYLHGTNNTPSAGLTSPKGGNQPHTNIPPWFGAYVWKRTS
mgnify:CR=1 FL=1